MGDICAAVVTIRMQIGAAAEEAEDLQCVLQLLVCYVASVL